MNIFSSIHRAYGNLKIQTKFLIMIILSASFPMIVIAVLLSQSLYRMVTSDTIREEQIATAKAAPVISESLDDVTTLSDLIRSYTFSRQLFDNSLTEPLYDLLHSEAAEDFEEKATDDLQGNIASAVRIYIDLPRTDEAFKGLPEKSLFVSMDSVQTTYWRGIFYSSHPYSLFCPPFYLSSTERKVLGDCAYIRPAYIRNGSDAPIQCYIAVYFHSGSLQNVLASHQTQKGSVSYITNERDAMVTSTDTALSGIYYMNYDSIRTNLMSSNGFLEQKILGETVYVSYYYLPTANWFLVTVTPSRPLQARANQVFWLLLLIWAGAIAIAILIGVLLSRSLTRRISSVSRQMSRVKNGLPIPMASPEETDEIGDLVDSYNYMARQINNLVEEQRRASNELRVAEFNSLQAQINPHFLYNTMEMINWMAQQGRIKETNQAIRDLSRFYKLTLSRKGTIGTVGDEIEHVTIYMRLQNMRFDNAIDFVVDVPDNLMEYRMPRLTLQPIVENAIIHGILEKPSRRGTVVLTGWLENTDLVLLISDDGVGIPADKLPLILTGNMPSTGKGSHIAISNTHRRIQILYGQQYGLHYSSTPGQGTEVEVRIPAYTQNDENLFFNKGGSLPIPRVTGNDSTAFVPESASHPEGKDFPNSSSAARLVRLNSSLARKRFQIHKLHNIFGVLPKDQNLYIVSHLVTEPFPAHDHDYFEMNYLCSGTLKNTIDGRDIVMSPGSILLMNKKATHAMDCIDGEALVMNICFNEEYVHEVLSAVAEGNTQLGSFLRGINVPLNYLYYPFGHITGIQPILSRIIEVYAGSRYKTSQEMDVLFYQLFQILAGCEPENTGSDYARLLI